MLKAQKINSMDRLPENNTSVCTYTFDLFRQRKKCKVIHVEGTSIAIVDEVGVGGGGGKRTEG